MRLELIHRSESLVAIHKPSGLATIPGRGETTSVLEQLGVQLGIPASGTTDPRVRVVHRLDKDTSGVLLFALDVAAQRHLSHQFQNNRIAKEYLAIVAGTPGADEGTIDAPIAVHPTVRTRMSVQRHGRPAVTVWRVEKRFRRFALLRCFPKTGKTHQIRVHLAHIGHPLVIDPIYGGLHPLMLSAFKRDYRPSRNEEERPLISRLTLHAEKLGFTDLAGQEMALEATPPKDFRAAINQLSRHG